MRLSKQKILGIDVTTNSKKETLEYIEKYLEMPAKKSLVIATPNPEQVVLAQKDNHFRKLLNCADVAIPDGIGLALTIGCKRVPGVEFMEALVGLSARRGFPIALIGGRGGVALKSLECLQARFPGLIGWAVEPEEKTLEEVTKKIVATKAQLVFVGLGAPKQEYFIENVKCQMFPRKDSGQANVKSPLILMSVGGAFDIIAGKTARAPAAVRFLGLEWLWRLAHQPWRFRRQLALVRFILLVLAEKFPI